LQHKIYQQADKVPEELKEIISEETYNKARVYGLDKSSFGIVKEFFAITTTVVRHYLLQL
jgi:STE24 endopeptidase